MLITHAGMAGSTRLNLSIYRLVQFPWRCFLVEMRPIPCTCVGRSAKFLMCWSCRFLEAPLRFTSHENLCSSL
jgi:hypothetical protein